MKKLVVTSLVALFTVSSANAGQWFVGGSVGFDTAKDDHTSFEVAPEIGYKLNDKWDIGLDLGFAKVTYEDDFTGDEWTERHSKVAAFARYNVAQFGALNVLLKGSIGANFIHMNGENGTILTASVIPMVTYALSDSFVLHAELNFLGFNAAQQLKNDDMGWANSWGVGFGADANDVLNTKDFQIGFTYNF